MTGKVFETNLFFVKLFGVLRFILSFSFGCVSNINVVVFYGKDDNIFF